MPWEEVSTARINGTSKRGKAKTSEFRSLCLSSFMHFVCLVVQMKETPLRKSSSSGLDMALKFGINFLNQYNSPMNLWSSLAEVGRG